MVRVTCAIIKDADKVFAARRGHNARNALKWEFPGGKVEPGETHEECLKRELAEELEIQVQIIGILPSFIHNYPEFTIELLPFLCTAQNKVHFLAEHAESGWFTKNELMKLEWAEADIALMHYVVENVL